MVNKKVVYFVTDGGQSSFVDWLDRLDQISQAIILRMVQRVARGGSKKSVKSLKHGVFEIKIQHGAGLRVYFAKTGDKIILLLIGGDKKTQSRDIEKAKKYWRSYGK